MEKLQPQPAADWDRELVYCGWEEVPSSFLVCEADRLLPAELQMQLAGIAGSEIIKCEEGHMVQLSRPEKVVEVVERVLKVL
jgi:pimeloyl-ACP methyl ester carboxylesterase